MNVFTVVPKQPSCFVAVRAWVNNTEHIEALFGDYVRRAPDGPQVWEILVRQGPPIPVFRGDWVVLTAENVIRRYSSAAFNREFTIMEDAFTLNPQKEPQ